MGWSAKATVFNESVVQVRGDRIAIRFPAAGENEIVIFPAPAQTLTENQAERVAATLRRWLKDHLEDNGVVFDEM